MTKYICIDTSTPVCRIVYVQGTTRHEYTWDAGRMLAKNIFSYINEVLDAESITYEAIAGFGVFRGPGSFTGLRIGIAAINTIASTLHVPIVGETGDSWLEKAIARLIVGDNDTLVLPEYGSDARITKPRK